MQSRKTAGVGFSAATTGSCIFWQFTGFPGWAVEHNARSPCSRASQRQILGCANSGLIDKGNNTLLGVQKWLPEVRWTWGEGQSVDDAALTQRCFFEIALDDVTDAQSLAEMR